MVTQDFLSNLWGRYNLTYKNVAIFETDGTMTPRASTTLTPQESNPVISTGGYRAPVQIVNVLPPMIKPRYRESNEMNPLEQKQANLAMEKIAVPDPRMNITGNYVPTPQKLENMGIQTAPFNYNAIFGVLGILGAIIGIVWLARK